MTAPAPAPQPPPAGPTQAVVLAGGQGTRLRP
ncbi:nucleotidyltransferase family protein, partial [Streptomyces sp. CAI-78]|nr:nucleotidyltransferase family protein [Streptomyces sp. CAI-78]